MILSPNSTFALEDVMHAAGPDQRFWFQLYVSQDRQKSSHRCSETGLNGRKTQLLLPRISKMATLTNRRSRA